MMFNTKHLFVYLTDTLFYDSPKKTLMSETKSSEMDGPRDVTPWVQKKTNAEKIHRQLAGAEKTAVLIQLEKEICDEIRVGDAVIEVYYTDRGTLEFHFP